MRFLILTALGLALASCGDSSTEADGGTTFRFSAIPDEKPTEQRERFQPVAEYLEEQLGVPVEYVPVNKYSASVQAFKNGDIHAAWFGGLSGVQARLAVEGSRAVAQGDADPDYYSYFIAYEGSGLTASDAFPHEARGKRFTFGSEGSTSGRLMPEFFLREAVDERPEDFFSAVGFSGNHPATIAAVNSGAFDVGAVSYKVYDKAAEEEKAATFVLWKTPVYPDYNFTIAGDLDATFGAGFSEALTEAWRGMPADLCQRSFSREAMIPAENDDFSRIEETAISLGLARPQASGMR